MIVTGSPVDNPAGQNTQATAPCLGQYELSGGVFTSSAELSVNIDATAEDVPGSWGTFVQNSSSQDETITPYVICAGTQPIETTR